MNEIELKNIWRSYDQKIDKILTINKQQLHLLQKEKADSKIQSFIRNHVRVMLLGLLWIFMLIFLAVNTLDNTYFVVSLSGIILFNIFAVLIYLRHIIILGSIDIAESINQTQQKLAKDYTSFTNSGRVLLLQAPIFCTWWYTEELVQNGGTLFWIVQLIIVVGLTIFSIYLYRKLSPNNTSNKWRNWSNKYFGAEKLQKAMDYLKAAEVEN